MKRDKYFWIVVSMELVAALGFMSCAAVTAYCGLWIFTMIFVLITMIPVRFIAKMVLETAP